MKTLKQLLIILLLAKSGQSQDTTYTYHDSTGKEVPGASANFIRKKFRQDDSWVLLWSTPSGKMVVREAFANDSLTIRTGPYARYGENGKIFISTQFKNGKEEGIQTIYYETGNKLTEGSYLAGLATGEWAGYFPSGKLSATAIYEKGHQVKATFYNEDGSPRSGITEFYREAMYPGGAEALKQYLNANLRYPKQAKEKGIQGSVVVQFRVEKDGTLSQIATYKSVDPLLDQEAIRVVQRMPKWTPAISAGLLTEGYARQPITFRLQDQ